MQFVDLHAQQARIRSELETAMAEVLRHGQYIMGPEIARLEDVLSGRLGGAETVSCSSGSTALDLAFMGLGLQAGDAVFTTPLSFVSTAESIARTGATPVFVDIDPRTFNMDSAQLEQAIEAVLRRDERIYPLPVQAREGLRPRAVVPVDLFGCPADYAGILPLAARYGLEVVEDGAQGYGGWHQGRPLCHCGCRLATTSFFPAKPLGCYGDGGAVFTEDAELAARLRSLRYHGRTEDDKNNNVRLGTNGRMDTLQAAILLTKLTIFDDELRLRQEAALRYTAALGDVDDVITPVIPEGCSTTWAQYTILLPAAKRARVMAHLKARDIPSVINYPRGLHLQGAFSHLGYRPDALPTVCDVTARVLSLPMHPYLTDEQQHAVAACIKEALA